MATININTKCLRRGWKPDQVGLLVYMLDQADNWGLIHCKPAVWAMDTQAEPQRVEEILQTFIAGEVFIPYEVDGQQYLATPHWQDEQTRKYFAKKGPDCPIPPLQVFRKLSAKSQGNFRHCAEKLSAPCAVAVAVAVADAVVIRERQRICIQAYAEGYRDNLAGGVETPTIDAADTTLLGRRLVEADEGENGWKRVLRVIEYAVSGDYAKFKQSPPALRTILAGYNYNPLKAILVGQWQKRDGG